MAEVCRLFVGILTALVLCKCSWAEWNVTDVSASSTVSDCHRHGDGDNCTANTEETEPWDGHFSKCPEELAHYCVHGDCRYVTEQMTPSCRCFHGYVGSRCEYLDLGLQIGEKRYIIIGGVIGGLVLLVLLIVFICFCSHRRCGLCWRRRRRWREDPMNGTEKVGMMDTDGHKSSDSTDAPQTNAV